MAENSSLVTAKIRAAQYVRMSTEHQQYSTLNQADAIRDYAQRRGLDVVKTYTDEGRSGLDLEGRPGLQRLLEDVQSPNTGFSAVLVFDVSRWGRFQDADESAYYEYLCKRAGIAVHYCAEQFENDGGPTATIIKSVKRAMAGEYSRELSNKVFKGKCRLIELGYRQGGPAGYGLRRMMIDAAGNPKGELRPGEWKSLHTDRVVLTLGPPEEVAIVRSMYDWLVDEDESFTGIARRLNADGVCNDRGKPWTIETVREVLTNEKYVGNNVFNRHSAKLRSPQTKNTSAQWIRKANAFPRLIDLEKFRAAQRVLEQRKAAYSNEELVALLEQLLRRHGRLSNELIDEDKDCPSQQVFIRRFGSLRNAYRLIDYQPRQSYQHLVTNERLESLRIEILNELLRHLAISGASVTGTDPIRISNQLTVALELARQRTTRTGTPSWVVPSRRGTDADVTIIGRMDLRNQVPADYHFLPREERQSAPLLASEATSVPLRSFRHDDLMPLLWLASRRPIEALQ